MRFAMAPATRNLHVPLPELLHAELRAAAERTGRPATELARAAIDRWLQEEKRAAIRAEVAAYAAAHAGTTSDLDPALERAGVESLLAVNEPTRRARRRKARRSR